MNTGHSNFNRLRFTPAGWIFLSLGLWLLPLVGQSAALRFEVTADARLPERTNAGRLFVILSATNNPEPRLTITRAGVNAPISLARDWDGFGSRKPATLDGQSLIFPIARLTDLPPDDYYVQAAYEWNPDLRLVNAPGNLYSPVTRIRLGGATGGTVKLELKRKVAPDQPPPDTDQIKYLKIQSRLLSEFYHRPIFLRASVILPRGYDQETTRRYPLWVRIGGFNTRYTAAPRLLSPKSEVGAAWKADDTARVILLQLDGAGPYGDPYQINSANCGPYGDALTQELIPLVENRFRGMAEPKARFLSGVSTGGWVALALQIFYPDFFNGAWGFCPDPVDFHALELINLYEAPNAYINPYGNERPSERDILGDTVLTVRREVGMENLLGHGNSFTLSGEQWGAWNAVFGPRGKDGLPVAIWDPRSGVINHEVAEYWKRFDLKLVLEQNWKTLAPKLRNKLHIAAGEADNFFLNDAVYLLEDWLSQVDPPFEGKIVYGPRKTHGWADVSVKQMLEEMDARAHAH